MPDDATPRRAITSGTPIVVSRPPRLPVLAFGTSLDPILAVTCVLCVAFDLLFPGKAIYQTWRRSLSGFSWLCWPSFPRGLVESFACGWYVTLAVAPPFDFSARRWNR